MKKIKTWGLVVLVFGLLFSFNLTLAQNTTSVDNARAALIAQIRARIEELQRQILALQAATTGAEVATSARFLRNLNLGSQGDDVEDLQELLAEDSEVYPEGLVTGHFGQLTHRAVKRFQKKHGLEEVGTAGPRTRVLLEGLRQAKAMKGRGNAAPILTGTASTSGQVMICHRPPGNPANANTITVGAPALRAHLAHGDTVGACGSTTTPPPADTTAPVISGLIATSTASTTTTIIWTTTADASNSAVWYHTATPLNFSLASKVQDSSLVTAHSLNLTGLTASTTYYFAAVSADAAGNTATSSTNTFITLP